MITNINKNMNSQMLGEIFSRQRLKNYNAKYVKNTILYCIMHILKIGIDANITITLHGVVSIGFKIKGVIIIC